MDFTVELAGVKIAVCSLFGEVYELCRDYLCEGTAAFSVTTTAADIAFEREQSAREAARAGHPEYRFHDSYLETLAVYRKITLGLLDHDTILMHGAAVCAAGVAYLFTAPSGTGKTTHIRFWLEKVPGARVINGDKPLIRVKEDGCRIYGTPWAGKEGWNENSSAPLRAICLLERGRENEISEIGFHNALSVLVQQTHRPYEAQAVSKTLELIGSMAKTVRFYRLACNMDPDAARVSFEGMKP